MTSAKYHLDVFVDSNSKDLLSKYDEKIGNHNIAITKPYPDSGFDILTPSFEYHNLCRKSGLLQDSTFEGLTSLKPTICVDMKICVAMRKMDDNKTPSGCYLYARSSLSKMPFRLANNQGIIDSGYRGSIKAMFDVDPCTTTWESMYNNFKKNPETAPDPTNDLSVVRLTQICAPGLEPFSVRRVETKEELETTWRGEGGIGSTGL